MPKGSEVTYEVVIPKKVEKDFQKLYRRRKTQLGKVIIKLQLNPTNFDDKNIEKLRNPVFGSYTIRVSRGDRLFYNIDFRERKVVITRAGSHDLYNFVK